EPDVQPQDRDVERDDPGQKNASDDDPREAARDAVSLLRPAVRPRGGLRLRSLPRAPNARGRFGGGGVPGRHQTLTAALRRADAARGLFESSRWLGRIARRGVARSTGSRPQTQTGKSGGQVQPRSWSRTNCLTIRSSSEWKLITASRPPGFSSSTAAGSASSSAVSSSLTAIRSAWKTRFAGWPSPNRAGAGIAALIVSTSSPVRSNALLRRLRAIARAICFA